jgi:hypothetical protein
MTAMGQTRSSACFRCRSAQAPQADLQAAQCDVAEVPLADLSCCGKALATLASG